MAGDLVRGELRGSNGIPKIRHVDSEHSAIWQCLVGDLKQVVLRPGELERVSCPS
jgi:1-deoxy-D-xylulose 5-phosphate reductoisomerase